jgi:hypothetical protein
MRGEDSGWRPGVLAPVNAGGSIRGESSTMGDGWKGERGEGERCGLSVRMGGEQNGGGGEGDVTHACSTVNVSAIRQTHEPPRVSTPCISNPNFPIATPALDSSPHPRAMSPFPPPRILRPADACNSPMLNSQHSPLSTFMEPHTRSLPPPPPRESPADPPPTPAGATICVQSVHLVHVYARLSRAHTLFIDSCQS